MKRICTAIAAFLFTSFALAAEIGQIGPNAESKGDFLVFTDEVPSFCLNGAKLVWYVSGKGNKIPGCWLVEKGKVVMQFADGDEGQLDRDAITWKPGMKPALYTI